jgi:uncharacterized protein (DUF302 family)
MMTIEVGKGGLTSVVAALPRHIANLFRAATVLPESPAGRIGAGNEVSEPAREKTRGRWALAMQATGAKTFTCSVRQPFRKTVHLLRGALKQEGISSVVEIDASARGHSAFGVELRSCRILCVACPPTLLPAAVADARAIGLFPLHVVVAVESAVESNVYLATAPSTGLNDGLTLASQRFLGRILSIILHVAGR